MNGKTYSFIDLFAGVGGMRLAYEAAGCRCVYSNEWNPKDWYINIVDCHD